MDLLKIVENQITPFVLPLKGHCDPEVYDLPYRVRDVIPRGTKMSNYPSIVVETPMLGKTHFGVSTNNPHLIRCNMLTSGFQAKTS
jgi:hypothetical protein